MMNCDRVSLQADFEQVGVFGGGKKKKNKRTQMAKILRCAAPTRALRISTVESRASPPE